MNRQVRLAALATATVAATVGFSSGQSPPAAGPAGSTTNAGAGPVYIMKTAGQPERRVQVIRSETQPDGSILTDVKDLTTGNVYTLTNPAFLGKKVPATGAAESTVAARPTAPTAPPSFGASPAPRPVDAGTPRPLFGQFPVKRPVTPVAQERLVPVESVNASNLPHARNRSSDPLLAGVSTPAGMAARTPFPAASNIPQEPPSVIGKVFGDPMKSMPTPRVGMLPAAPATPAPPPSAAKVAGLPKSTPGVTVIMPSLATASVPRMPRATEPATPPTAAPTPAAPTRATTPPKTSPAIPATAAVQAPPAGLAIPLIDRNAKPSASTGLFDSQSGGASVILPPINEADNAPPTVLPPVNATVESSVTRPVPVEVPAAIPSQPAVPQVKVEVPPAVPAVAPQPAIPQPEKAVAIELPPPAIVPPDVTGSDLHLPVPTIPVVDVPVLAPQPAVLPAVLPKEIVQMIDDIANHKRPSFRMENASALAQSPYAKHPDAIASLLRCAANDKVGIVRGHCITCLAEMGYADVAFVRSLSVWTTDLEPAVRRAAVDAKAKLGR